MATAQTPIDGRFDASNSESIDDSGTEIDVFGCAVEGCSYSAPSVIQLYCHMNGKHANEGGMPSIRQELMVEQFRQFGKEARETRATLDLNMPF